MRRCAVGVLVKDHKILMGKRTDERKLYPSLWDFFGGHAEKGESLEDCLRRELLEELAITPTDFSAGPVVAEPFPERYGPGHYHFFRVAVWTGAGPLINNHEHSEIAWFDLDQALALDLCFEAYRDILRTMVTAA